MASALIGEVLIFFTRCLTIKSHICAWAIRPVLPLDNVEVKIQKESNTITPHTGGNITMLGEPILFSYFPDTSNAE